MLRWAKMVAIDVSCTQLYKTQHLGTALVVLRAYFTFVLRMEGMKTVGEGGGEGIREGGGHEDRDEEDVRQEDHIHGQDLAEGCGGCSHLGRHRMENGVSE